MHEIHGIKTRLKQTHNATSPQGLRRARFVQVCERKKFIIRQPPIGGKDDYDGENSWISDGLHNSSRRKRRGDGRGEGGEWSEK